MRDHYHTHESLLRRMRDYLAAIPNVPATVLSKYEKLADPVAGRAVMRLLEYELRVARCDPAGRVVLDAGCGTGMYSVLFALLGARRIDAFDMFPDNVEFLGRLAREFQLPIEPRQGDVAKTSLHANSVGLTYCTEAISHFHDWAAFLDEGARVLGPSGVMIIADGNNGANPVVKRRIFDFWEESEVGPFTRDDPSKNLPYVFRRWMILRKAFPEATEHQIFALGLHTSHLGGAELIEAAREYLSTGQLPGSLYRRGQSQIRPEDRQRNEEPLEAGMIAERLRRHGLQVRARAHFGFNRSPLLPVLNEVAVWFGELPLYFSERYLVIARKPPVAVA